jgi:hypothetical protein
MGIAEVISGLSLLLNVFTSGRGVLRDKKDGDLLHPRLLLETRETLQYLRGAIRQFRIALADGIAQDEQHLLLLSQDFLTGLRVFTNKVQELNLGVLSIYDPEMAGQLERAFGVDSAIVDELQERADFYGPKQGLGTAAKDARRLHKLHDRLRVLYQDIDSVAYEDSEAIFDDTGRKREDFASQLGVLEGLLEKLSEQIAHFIKVNWAPKDLS